MHLKPGRETEGNSTETEVWKKSVHVHTLKKIMQGIFSAILLAIIAESVLVLADSKSDLATANNAFAFDLYKKIDEENKGRNLFLSPMSISSAFGILNLGARNNSQTQLKKVLHLDKIGSDTTINDAYREVLSSFATKGNNYTLNLVNRLFGSNEYQFRSQFKEESERYFNASLEGLDFITKTEESRLHINDWVLKETNQKIKDLLPSGSIDQLTKLVIVNAIYFNGIWKHIFDKNSTRKDAFHVSKTEQVQMDMMAFLGPKYFNYYNSTELDCQVLELPYVGGKASMIIFLPREVDGLSKLEEKLTGDKLSEMLTSMRSAEIRLKFPKFKMEQDISLKKFLELLGMKDLFCRDHSDLSGIGGPGRLTATDAIHKSYVNVDEVGTEAAAATAITVSVTSLRPPPIEITVDRPFLFMIIEKNTNAVLFLGRLVRPPAALGESIGKFGETAALKDNKDTLNVSKDDSERLNVSKGFILLHSALGLLLISWRKL